MSGKLDTLSFSRQADGTSVMRVRRAPANPKTTVQQANRERFAAASQMWQTLTSAEMATWDAYAILLHESPATPSLTRIPATYPIFVRLTSKFLAVNPNQTPPRTAPQSRYSGEDARITVTSSAGQLIFKAAIPNSPGVTTEFLIEKLATNGRRGNLKMCRSQGFHTYTPGTLSHAITVKPGHYFVAVRYTLMSTGESSELTALGKVEVA